MLQCELFGLLGAPSKSEGISFPGAPLQGASSTLGIALGHQEEAYHRAKAVSVVCSYNF